jgi:hypothetical protein
VKRRLAGNFPPDQLASGEQMSGDRTVEKSGVTAAVNQNFAPTGRVRSSTRTHVRPSSNIPMARRREKVNYPSGSIKVRDSD